MEIIRSRASRDFNASYELYPLLPAIIFRKFQPANIIVIGDADCPQSFFNGIIYDFYSMKGSVTKTVRGPQGANRRWQRTWSMQDSEYGKAVDNLAKLMNVLYTILNKDIGNKPEDIDAACEEVKGQLCKTNIQPQKCDGEVLRDEQGFPKHKVTIVSEFKEKGKVLPVDLTESEEPVPF